MASRTEPNNEIVFMPIKPEYAFKILSGEKKFEFRKSGIRPTTTKMVIYASAPVKRILGVADITAIHVQSPIKTWKATREVAGINMTSFLKYFEGRNKAFAIELDSVEILDRSVHPSEVDKDFVVPQSYRYVSKSFIERVYRLSKTKCTGTYKDLSSLLVEYTEPASHLSVPA